MRVVLQRVIKAAVRINNAEHEGINHGLLLLVGIEDGDSQEDINWLAL